MSTAIQWTDETWNAITGCKQVSPGCAHCYAKVEHDRRHKAHRAGKKVARQYAEPFEVVQLHPDRLDAPLRRRKPTRYFVTSGADPFHEDVPDEFIARLFAVMALADRHTFQLLTKRPARMQALLAGDTFLNAVLDAAEPFWERAHPESVWGDDPIESWFPWMIETGWPMRNIWLGVSVENQRWADERIPLLLDTPAAVRFLSCEPLLGPVDLRRVGGDDSDWRVNALTGEERYPGSVRREVRPPIDWVIVGGESGALARPVDVEWIADILAQCCFAGVPAFVKQMGARPTTPEMTHWRCAGTLLPDSSGYALRLNDSHGGDPDEWPAELRVREFPASGVRA